jgi:hypothetical protein
MLQTDNTGNSRDVIFSKAIKAGKRTYFFDVKATRSNDYFLIITESKKKFGFGDDKPFYEKHKIFLYKEDFEKFVDGLNEALDNIKNQPEDAQNYPSANEEQPANPFTDINFDDDIK